ncbi:hypothetical protein GCM10027043_04250 [Ferruginibacter profundus]
MGHKIFKVSYLLFIISMIVIYLTSVAGVISFGIDGSTIITQIGIVLVIIVSIPIFWVVNKNRNESSSINTLRSCLIVLMGIVIIFLVNDFLSHN